MSTPSTIGIVRADAVRRTVTPSGTMTTMMSPTLGGSERLSLWQVEFAPGSSGPEHSIDSEQIWTLLTGSATCTLDGESVVLQPGDTVGFPANMMRRIAASDAAGSTGARFLVCGSSDALALTPTAAEAVAPPWIA